MFAQNPVVKRHTVKQILAVPPKHLYNIILDVNSYSNFIPFCKSSQVLRTSKCGTMFDASLQIGFGQNEFMFQEEYVSRVTKKIRKIEHENDNYDGDLLEWIVIAKSIKSTLFNNLNSSWKLTKVSKEGHGGSVIPNLINHDESALPPKQSFDVITNVEFEVEINVSNPIISTALDVSLEEVAKQQVAAFEKRCYEVPFNGE